MDVMQSFLGKTIVSINRSFDELEFIFSTGEVAKMLHYQDCCESVTIDDIAGDLDDLLNSKLILSEEVSNKTEFEREEMFIKTIRESNNYCSDSETWTFYRMGTVKGDVVIRWYGSSNGYYSESVNVEYIT